MPRFPSLPSLPSLSSLPAIPCASAVGPRAVGHPSGVPLRIGTVWIAAAALLAGSLAAAPAAAQDGAVDGLAVALGGGLYGLDDDQAALGRAEVRFGDAIEPAPWLVPVVGVEFTSDAAFYGYGGFLFDIPLGTNGYLAPNAAVGFYEEGDGRDLGHAIEFRTGVEVGWRFDSGPAVGLAFHHLSNAGLDDDNPGVETLTLNVTLPLQ